jgi:hypothetical protein
VAPNKEVVVVVVVVDVDMDEGIDPNKEVVAGADGRVVVFPKKEAPVEDVGKEEEEAVDLPNKFIVPLDGFPNKEVGADVLPKREEEDNKEDADKTPLNSEEEDEEEDAVDDGRENKSSEIPKMFRNRGPDVGAVAVVGGGGKSGAGGDTAGHLTVEAKFLFTRQMKWSFM